MNNIEGRDKKPKVTASDDHTCVTSHAYESI